MPSNQVTRMSIKIEPLTCLTCADEQQTDDSQQCANTNRVEILREVHNGDQRCAVYDQLGVLQSQESDKQTDADRHAFFQLQRNGIEDSFPHVGQRENDENQTLDKDGEQRKLPRIAHLADNGVCKVCIESEAGRQRKRIICEQSHAEAADE